MDKLDAFARERIPHSEEYYDLLKYDLDPGGFFQITPGQKLPHITINSAGFRGREWTGGETILLLGDSVAFGVGASSDEDVLARFVESALGGAVADASVRAYRVFQHFNRLPSYLSRLPKLKKVILWGGYADLLFWAIKGRRLEGAFNFGVRYAPKPRLERVLIKIAGKLSRLFAGAAGTNGAVEPGRTGTAEDLADHVFTFTSAIHDLCKAHSLEFVFVYQPFLAGEGLSDSHLKTLMAEVEKKTKAHTGVSWAEGAALFKARLFSRIEGKEGLKVIDGSRFFNENDFLDQVHLKPVSLKRFSDDTLKDWSSHL